ncbi:MAG: c-type cytochrome, partial [Myxococcota bacterium]
HALMRIDLFVDSKEDFARWVEAQKAPAAAPSGALAKQGATAFLTAGCIACHRIAGTPAQSPIGPDLTHVGSRKHLASGILENTPETMARWIRNPQAVKPGAKMAKLELSDEQVESIVSYLQGLK